MSGSGQGDTLSQGPGCLLSPLPQLWGRSVGATLGSLVVGSGAGGHLGVPRSPQRRPSVPCSQPPPLDLPGKVSQLEAMLKQLHSDLQKVRGSERWGGLCVPVPSPSEHAEQWGVIVCVSPPRDNPFSPPRRSRTRWCCRQRWPTCGRTTGGCRRNRTQLPGSSDVLPGYSPVQLRKKSCEPRGGPPPPGDPWGH